MTTKAKRMKWKRNTDPDDCSAAHCWTATIRNPSMPRNYEQPAFHLHVESSVDGGATAKIEYKNADVCDDTSEGFDAIDPDRAVARAIAKARRQLARMAEALDTVPPVGAVLAAHAQRVERQRLKQVDLENKYRKWRRENPYRPPDVNPYANYTPEQIEQANFDNHDPAVRVTRDGLVHTGWRPDR